MKFILWNTIISLLLVLSSTLNARSKFFFYLPNVALRNFACSGDMVASSS